MDEIKFIINELNKPPFNKGLNIVSYDTLRGEQRIEILLQVFDEIDSTVIKNILNNLFQNNYFFKSGFSSKARLFVRRNRKK